ncbi:MAG: DUF1016 family protein [Anaerolineae bacterium]|nr:DUF1016 family protein [Anaerolineae bacterium]
MDDKGTPLTIWVTRPRRKLAQLLAEMGIDVQPIVQDEGNVDRYVVSERVVVERRTGSGFLQGIMDKTLFTSAIYMREHFQVPVLIVEGEIDYDYTAFSPLAVRGALSSMVLQYGLSVLSTPNVEETVNLIAMMARQEQVGIPEISLIPKRKATDLADLQRRVVEMLPGCGMVVARDLLQHFGSIRRIVEATEVELGNVPGIGVKKAAQIYRVLNAEYASLDTEKQLEDAIEADPSLLFERPVRLLARQHRIYTEAQEQQIVDLVFLDETASELVLVELKRDRLMPEHEAQLLHYLAYAPQSSLLSSYLSNGTRLCGILATAEPCQFVPQNGRIRAQTVERNRVIDVLRQLRARRLALDLE